MNHSQRILHLPPYELSSARSTVSRIVEICFCFLFAFLVIVIVSLLTLRPTLREVKLEAGADWESFVSLVAERNTFIPGLVQGLRGFQSGHNKTIERLMESRAVLLTTNNPEAIVRTIDEMNRLLGELEQISIRNTQLLSYPPYAEQYQKVFTLTQKINATRKMYDRSARLYNRLLRSFPQSLLTPMFGFSPMTEYPG